ncbi:MAG: hypothetical protein VW518_10350 [Burkholderiaceae bacterium]
MAIKLNADEAFTVYCAMDDALHRRRNGTGSKHDYLLTEEEHLKLMTRYLRSALVLERIEGGK